MKKKFFLKRVAIYFCMMLIPMTLLFLAFGAMNLYNINQDLNRQGKQTINAIDVNFDLVLSNVLYQNDLLTSTTRMNMSLKRILYQDQMTYGDAANISSLRSILSSIKDSHEYVESIYIYLDGAQRFFSSDKGIHVIGPNEDTEWITIYDQMEEKRNTYIAGRQITHEAIQPTEVLSIYKRLLLQPGCIVVNLNLDKLTDILENQITNQEEAIFILNHKGEVLAWKKRGDSPAPELSFFDEIRLQKAGTWEKILGGMDGKWADTGKGPFLFHTGTYEEMGVYYVSAISGIARRERILELLKFFFLFLLVDLTVVAVLAYRTTKRSFDQISYMVKVFNESEKGLPVKKPDRKSRDEYDVIMNNIIYLFLNTNYLNSQLKENKYKREHAEMLALQLQINPHFLFNTLQTVDMEIRKPGSDRKEISSALHHVSDILKYALSDPSHPVILEEEMEYLKKYVAVQKFRFGDQFIIYYEVDEELLGMEVFRLFLQPLVENSLLHGLRKANRKGYIKIAIHKWEERMRCCVVDTGIGMNRQEIEELNVCIRAEGTRGIGLANLNRRLILRYGEESALHIRSKKDIGTAISFYVPCIYPEK